MIAHTDEDFMRLALRQACTAFEEDEVPVGAIIIHQNKIIAKAYNQVETLNDPTAHAEMIAITQASAALQNKWLHDCTLYVTIEPCIMCAGALILSRISRIVFGACDPKTGAFGSVTNINDLKLNHTLFVTPNILESDCADLIRRFFQKKRVKNN